MNSKAIVEGAFLGLLGGILVALGGAIKDSPYEGFDWKKFVRSPMVGAAVGAVIGYAFPDSPKPLVLLSSMAGERMVVETYKLIRSCKGEYVPMKFIYGEWGVKKSLTEEGKRRLKLSFG